MFIVIMVSKIGGKFISYFTKEFIYRFRNCLRFSYFPVTVDKMADFIVVNIVIVFHRKKEKKLYGTQELCELHI